MILDHMNHLLSKLVTNSNTNSNINNNNNKEKNNKLKKQQQTTEEETRHNVDKKQKRRSMALSLVLNAKRVKYTSTNNDADDGDCGVDNMNDTCNNIEFCKVITATACCPKKPSKSRFNAGKPDCGEDAYFNLHTPSNKLGQRVLTMGVSDGVGSYAARGVDPADMAWALMDGCKEFMAKDETMSWSLALDKCYSRIVKSKSVAMGAATACLLSLNNGLQKVENGVGDMVEVPVLELTAANLGDSLFMIIRDGQVFYKSEEQTHGFNCPYQLAVPRNEANPMQDSPKKANVISSSEPIIVQRGDVIILCTDGLSDNVFDSEIAEVVSRNIAASTESSSVSFKIASELLRIANHNSKSKEVNTPFGKYANDHQFRFQGGKLDDLTMQVAHIV